jgi:hypothetical protein
MSDTTISTPDTSELQPRILALEELRNLKITDAATLQAAKDGIDACAELQKHETLTKISTACAEANSLHKTLTALRDSFLDPIESISRYLRGTVARYLEDQERLALERHLQEQAELADKQAEEERDPWEQAPEPSSVKVSLAPSKPLVTGLSLRKLPKKAEIVGYAEKGVFSEGFKLLVLAAAEKLKQGDDSMLVFLEPNGVALTARAREWGKKIFEERIPGVVVIDDKKTVSRR